jgi:capsular exopolysaccharide synthesis family protein
MDLDKDFVGRIPSLAGSNNTEGPVSDPSRIWKEDTTRIKHLQYTHGHDEGIDINALIRILRRRSALILGVAVVLPMLTYLLLSQIMPRYTAEATLVLHPRKTQVVRMEAVLEDHYPDRHEIQTQIEVLQSRSHAQRVIKALDLIEHPEFKKEERTLFTTLAAWMPTKWTTEAIRTDDHSDGSTDSGVNYSEVELTDAAINRILNKLSIVQDAESRALSIAFTSTDPEMAARIANAIADLFIERQIETKSSAVDQATQWLVKRVGELRTSPLEEESRIEQYRSENELTTIVDVGTLDVQQLANVNAELSVARTERVSKEAEVKLLRKLTDLGEDHNSLSSIATSPMMESLLDEQARLHKLEAEYSEMYGDLHPSRVRLKNETRNLEEKINNEIKNIIRKLESELVVARNRESLLEGRMDEIGRHSAQNSEAYAKMRDLERNADTMRSLYGAYVTRLQETQAQKDLLEPTAELISKAMVPNEASFPKTTIMTMLTIPVSLIVGSFLALLVEHLNSRILSCNHLQQILKIPTLGLVPRVTTKKHRSIYSHIHDEPFSAYAEAIKGIRASIELLHPNGFPTFVLVTSSLPGEGKTTLTLSLGASLARSGRKTLVLDCDLRRREISRKHGVPIDSGVLEYFDGELDLDKAIYQERNEPNLHVMVVECATDSISDSLPLKKLRYLLTNLEHGFDHILIDSAPILAVTDTRILARLADAVVLAVQWNKTEEAAAVNGLKMLIDSQAHILGTVLTNVDLRHYAKYSSGDAGQYYKQISKYYA